MKLSPELHRQLEDFFREYFNDNGLKLPEIEIYTKGGAGIITKILSVHGITIGRHIFIKPEIMKFDKKTKRLRINKNLLAHEVAHVVQYQQLGFFGFLNKYLKDYFSSLSKKRKWHSVARTEAYWDIPHEIEARDAAREFEKWLRSKGKK